MGWDEFLSDPKYPQFKDKVNTMNSKLASATTPTKGMGKGPGKGKAEEASKGKTKGAKR